MEVSFNKRQKRAHRHREEEVGRDWRDMSTSQGMPKVAGRQQKLGERQGVFSQRPVEISFADTFTLHFWPLDLWRE